MAQHGRFKAFSLLHQRFKLSSACQILSFFLNKVLICLETLQSSPAAVSVAPGEHRVGSLPLSPAQRTKQSPSSLSLRGQWCRRREQEPDTERRTWNDPTPRANTGLSPFRPHRTTLQEPALEKMRCCRDGRLYKPPVNSGPQQAPALAGTSHQILPFPHSCIKRQNTSRYPSLPPHQWASISPWRWTKSHYLIGKAIWRAATREHKQQHHQGSNSLALLTTWMP